MNEEKFNHCAEIFSYFTFNGINIFFEKQFIIYEDGKTFLYDTGNFNSPNLNMMIVIELACAT